MADQGICGDIRNVEFLAQLGRNENVHGVFSHAVDLPHVVAGVAQQLGLPGLAPDVAVRATNKWRRYQCLESHGVPCPTFAINRNNKQIHFISGLDSGNLFLSCPDQEQSLFVRTTHLVMMTLLVTVT